MAAARGTRAASLACLVCLLLVTHAAAVGSSNWVKAALVETRSRTAAPARVAPGEEESSEETQPTRAPSEPGPDAPKEQDEPATGQVEDSDGEADGTGQLDQAIATAPDWPYGPGLVHPGHPYWPYHAQWYGSWHAPAPVPSKWRLRRPPIWMRRPGQPAQPWVWVYPPAGKVTKSGSVSSHGDADQAKKDKKDGGDGNDETAGDVKKDAGADTEGTDFYDNRDRQVLRQHMVPGSFNPIAFAPHEYGFHDALHQGARMDYSHGWWGSQSDHGHLPLPNDWFGRDTALPSNGPYYHVPYGSPTDPRWIVAGVTDGVSDTSAATDDAAAETAADL